MLRNPPLTTVTHLLHLFVRCFAARAVFFKSFFILSVSLFPPPSPPMSSRAEHTYKGNTPAPPPFPSLAPSPKQQRVHSTACFAHVAMQQTPSAPRSRTSCGWGALCRANEQTPPRVYAWSETKMSPINKTKEQEKKKHNT